MSENVKTTGIGGKVREIQDFNNEKYIGLAEVKVIAINPDREEFKEILGIDLKDDSKATDYIGESKDGNATVRIDFWVENIKNKKKDKITYFLEDKVAMNKDGTKTQYINYQGTTSWASDENDLWEWFKAGEYRVAKAGEEKLYKFLKKWLGKLKFEDKETVLSLDWKKLIKGNVSMLKEQINGEFSVNLGALYTVKVVNKDGEIKEYQTIYNGDVLPTYALKYFNILDYDKESEVEKIKLKESEIKIARAEKKKVKGLGQHEQFVLNVKGQYGCKDNYYLKPLRPYNSEDFLNTSDSPLEMEEDGMEY